MTHPLVTMHLLDTSGKEIEAKGYSPQQISGWKVIWCPCGRPEIRFVPVEEKVEFYIKGKWDLPVDRFELQLEGSVIRSFPINSEPIKIGRRGGIIEIAPFIENDIRDMTDFNEAEDELLDNLMNSGMTRAEAKAKLEPRVVTQLVHRG